MHNAERHPFTAADTTLGEAGLQPYLPRVRLSRRDSARESHPQSQSCYPPRRQFGRPELVSADHGHLHVSCSTVGLHESSAAKI